MDFQCIEAFLKVHSRHDDAEPHNLVDSVADLRKGGRWIDPWFGQYSFRGLMIVIAIGFLSHRCPLESSQWLRKNIMRSTVKKNSRKAWISALSPRYN